MLHIEILTSNSIHVALSLMRASVGFEVFYHPEAAQRPVLRLGGGLHGTRMWTDIPSVP